MLRVDHSAPGLSPCWIEYAGTNRYSQWVILRATSPTGDAAAMKTLDTAIRTLRKEGTPTVATTPQTPAVASPTNPAVQPPGNVQRPQTPAQVAAAKPLTASEVANIITTDYFNSKETLRRHGPRAEPGVVECLTSSDHRVKRVAAEVLPDVATAASIEKLKPLASSQDREVAKAVQSVLQKLAAAQFDAVSAALAEIKSNDTFRRRDAIRKLADIPPDDSRRDEVNELLEGFVLDAQFGNWDGDEAAKALATWASAKTATKLVPVLNNPKLDSWQRKRLIKALSGCHESRLAAAMVMKWMALEPDEVTASLTKMGPIAEDETIRILNANFASKDNGAQSIRSHCVQILTAVGTSKSFEVLGRVSRDPRDPIAQAVAKDAIETIKARAAASAPPKPATGPAK
jgi:hypothetical protein